MNIKNIIKNLNEYNKENNYEDIENKEYSIEKEEYKILNESKNKVINESRSIDRMILEKVEEIWAAVNGEGYELPNGKKVKCKYIGIRVSPGKYEIGDVLNFNSFDAYNIRLKGISVVDLTDIIENRRLVNEQITALYKTYGGGKASKTAPKLYILGSDKRIELSEIVKKRAELKGGGEPNYSFKPSLDAPEKRIIRESRFEAPVVLEIIDERITEAAVEKQKIEKVKKTLKLLIYEEKYIKEINDIKNKEDIENFIEKYKKEKDIDLKDNRAFKNRYDMLFKNDIIDINKNKEYDKNKYNKRILKGKEEVILDEEKIKKLKKEILKDMLDTIEKNDETVYTERDDKDFVRSANLIGYDVDDVIMFSLYDKEKTKQYVRNNIELMLQKIIDFGEHIEDALIEAGKENERIGELVKNRTAYLKLYREKESDLVEDIVEENSEDIERIGDRAFELKSNEELDDDSKIGMMSRFLKSSLTKMVNRYI